MYDQNSPVLAHAIDAGRNDILHQRTVVLVKGVKVLVTSAVAGVAFRCSPVSNDELLRAVVSVVSVAFSHAFSLFRVPFPCRKQSGVRASGCVTVLVYFLIFAPPEPRMKI